MSHQLIICCRVVNIATCDICLQRLCIASLKIHAFLRFNDPWIKILLSNIPKSTSWGNSPSTSQTPEYQLSNLRWVSVESVRLYANVHQVRVLPVELLTECLIQQLTSPGCFGTNRLICGDENGLDCNCLFHMTLSRVEIHMCAKSDLSSRINLTAKNSLSWSNYHVSPNDDVHGKCQSLANWFDDSNQIVLAN